MPFAVIPFRLPSPTFVFWIIPGMMTLYPSRDRPQMTYSFVISRNSSASTPETPAETDTELSETAHFPDEFQQAYISYPASIEPMQHLAVKNALNFNAVNAEGTDDQYVNIMFCFLPIEGYDEYMDKGYGAAKPYMYHMLETMQKGLQGKYLTKSITSDYVD